MRQEANNWLRQEKADFKTANDCLEDGNYYASAFFCQQTIEKCLKGIYIVRKISTPPKTHNLLELSLKPNIPEEFLNVVRELTPEFIITKYPDAIGGIPADLYDKEKSHRILEITREFFEWMMELEDLKGL
ncbi:MAG: HEPN domain-containing protein [Euryarchaeota archaeon]|nr:HEPN domain-containing protein [Euryarchaeota archaeon]